MKRFKKSFEEILGLGAVLTLGVGAVGAWQYTKFVGGYGFFHYLSPQHGDWILAGALVFVWLWLCLPLLARDER